jgi:hypothetical protein
LAVARFGDVLIDQLPPKPQILIDGFGAVRFDDMSGALQIHASILAANIR